MLSRLCIPTVDTQPLKMDSTELPYATPFDLLNAWQWFQLG